MIIVGFDPSFTNFGWASVELRPDGEVPLNMGVIVTKSESKKRRIRQMDDDSRRIQEIAGALLDLAIDDEVVALAAEAPLSAKSYKAARQMGHAKAILGTLATVWRIPLLEYSAQEIKKAACGRTSASKMDVMDGLNRRYDKLPNRIMNGRGLPYGRWEHAFDALGAVVASLDSDLVRGLRRQTISR